MSTYLNMFYLQHFCNFNKSCFFLSLPLASRAADSIDTRDYVSRVSDYLQHVAHFPVSSLQLKERVMNVMKYVSASILGIK